MSDTDPEWTKGVNLAMTGKQPVAQALQAAADKGNQILEANKKKYG